ncbi:hypothetical protein [Cupriavidus necator]|nr:hypothetical protein [Cupriavidus necator]
MAHLARLPESLGAIENKHFNELPDYSRIHPVAGGFSAALPGPS